MKRSILSIVFFISMLAIFAQAEYNIDKVTVINLGDGRLLYRDAQTEQPINGEQRIIDGYRSEYFLVTFKDGLFHGTLKHYKDNRLTMECDYKEGVRDGDYKTYYGDGETVKTHSNLVAGKLHGKAIDYNTDGRIEKDCEYKDGNPHGKHLFYHYETGELRAEENYVDGKLEGKQFRHITGSREYKEYSNYKDGFQDGEYIKEFLNGVIGESGYYKKGKKSGQWVKLNNDGDSLEIKTYENGELNGLSVEYFTTGERSKAYMYKNGKKDGKCIDYDNRTGEPKKIAEYKENREHGKVIQWMTSNQIDFVQTTTYENGKRNGPYEAVYKANDRKDVKDGSPKEKGQYKNDRKVGTWYTYNLDGTMRNEQNHD